MNETHLKYVFFNVVAVALTVSMFLGQKAASFTGLGCTLIFTTMLEFDLWR